jgi:hypothetical protein
MSFAQSCTYGDPEPLRSGGRHVFVADARIDNREELSRTLGETEATVADADLLCMAWMRWGLQAFDRVTGVFALAGWEEVAIAEDYYTPGHLKSPNPDFLDRNVVPNVWNAVWGWGGRVACGVMGGGGRVSLRTSLLNSMGSSNVSA